MSYIQDVRFVKRRPSVKHVTPEEAIVTANKVVDEANGKIARALAFAEQWKKVATELYEEVEQLRVKVAELEKQVKQMAPKAGKKVKLWRTEERRKNP